MNQEELQQKIAEYYQKLPPDAQSFFSEMKWLEALTSISKKYGLNDEQIQTLGTETMLVLLSIIHLDEYEGILKNELNMPEDSANKLLFEIEDSVLKTVRPQLIKTFEKNISEDAEIAETQEEKELFKEKKLDEHFLKLPKDIQQYIIDSNYQEKLYIISQEENLTVEQMGKLEEAVIDVILGKIKAENFETFLERALKISSEKNKILVEKINQAILRAIRLNFMRSTTEKTIEPKEEIATVTQKIEIKKEPERIETGTGLEIMPEELPMGEEEAEDKEREKILESIENPKPTPAYIAPTKQEIPKAPETKVEPATLPREEILKSKIPTPDFLPSKKLFNSFQSQETKTEHSINSSSQASTPAAPKTEADSSPKQKIDPYREIPE